MTTTITAPEVTPGEQTTRTWRIPASTADRARELVAKVNRRAQRAGLPGYTLTITTAPDRKVYDDHGQDVTAEGDEIPTGRYGQPLKLMWTIAQVDATLHGAVPRLGDWEPVAVITRDPEAGTITRPWPGVEVDLTPLRGRDAADCDHCHTNRHRKDTYAVRHAATGELRQVGSNCLAAYTGLDVNLADWFRPMKEGDELDSLAGGWGEDDLRVSVARCVEYGLILSRETGWVSREKAIDRTPTGELVREALFGRSVGAARLRETVEEQRDAATAERARAVIEWAKARTGTSEYELNLSALAGCEGVSWRNVALLASAVAGYVRHEAREIERRAVGESVWQGTVGKRETFAGLTVVQVHLCEGFYGLSEIVKLRDDAGNQFAWFTKRSGMEQGDRVDVTGAVKEHSEFRGVRETVLTRCKWVSVG